MARAEFYCMGGVFIPGSFDPPEEAIDGYVVPVLRAGKVNIPAKALSAIAYPITRAKRQEHGRYIDDAQFDTWGVTPAGTDTGSPFPYDASNPWARPDARNLWLTTLSVSWPTGRQFGRIYYRLQRLVDNSAPLLNRIGSYGGLPPDGYENGRTVELLATAHDDGRHFIGFRATVTRWDGRAGEFKLWYRHQQPNTALMTGSVPFEQGDLDDADVVATIPGNGIVDDYKVDVKMDLAEGQVCNVLLDTKKIFDIVAREPRYGELLLGPKIPFYFGARVLREKP